MNPINDAFVGRQRELSTLVSALDDAIASKGRLVMLVGEPGIGKTRTAQELASIAERRGARVLWGRCYEGEGAPPYWPWLQVLRNCIRHSDAETLQAQMGDGVADIGEMVPELRNKLPDLQPPPSLEPEQAQFRLFDSITTFLKIASETDALVLILDNLHWADASSLRLVEFLAQEMDEAHILIVGTYRDVDVSRGNPLYRTLGELTRLQNFQRVLLRGLGEADVCRIIEAESGVVPVAELATRIHQDTEGNPLFAGEIARLLAQEDRLTLADWEFRLPEGIREVIGRRLDSLSGECNEALRVASVIGREFSIQQLESLVDGMSRREALQVMEEALSRHIIEEVPQSLGRYQFSHALIQQTLLSELTTTRRVGMHARIVEVLEEIYGDEAEAHVVELANHAREAESLLGPDKLMSYSLLAGEQALAAHALEEAQTHFERGLVAARGIKINDVIAALHAGASQAQNSLRNIDEALINLKVAFDYYMETGQVDAAVSLAQQRFVSDVGLFSMIPILERALQLATPGSISEGKVLARYALAVHLLGDNDKSHNALDRVLAIAHHHQDTDLEIEVLESITNLKFHFGNDEDDITIPQRLVQLVSTIDAPLAESSAQCALAQYYADHGEQDRFEEAISAALVAAERTHNRERLSTVCQLYQRVQVNKGEWAIARAYADKALSYWSDDPRALAYSALVEFETGEFERGEMQLAALRELRNQSGRLGVSMNATVLPWIVRITESQEHVDSMVNASEWILKSQESLSLSGLTNIELARNVLEIAAWIAVHQNDQQTARRLYIETDTAIRRPPPQYGFGYRRLLLGRLAYVAGFQDDACGYFEDVLSKLRGNGFRPPLAWTCHDYSQLLLERNGPGDYDKAMSLITEAQTITQELGMRPLSQKLSALREKAETVTAKAPAYPDGLTQREVEVLRLIASGKSDREIAEELFIAVRTASTHVHNIFNKTGASSRAEATAYAFRNGLV